MTQAIEKFLAALDRRLQQGSQAYGDRSLLRPLSGLEREFDEELLDLAGWLYVIWTQAAERANMRVRGIAGERREPPLRREFLARMYQRMVRADRGPLDPAAAAGGAWGCLKDIEVLALDVFELREQLNRRLFTIARALEVARWLAPVRGRRGGAGIDELGRDSG